MRQKLLSVMVDDGVSGDTQAGIDVERQVRGGEIGLEMSKPQISLCTWSGRVVS